MNYKLAKQLKDAGFPKKYCKNFYATNNNGEEVLIPSLSELIEACGDGFFNLNYVKLHAPEAYPPLKRIQEIREGNLWVANGEQCWTTAKTPEESVAKLWLKLTKK